MGRIPTSIVRDAHAYTRSETPWILDSCGDEGGSDASAKAPRRGWRLFRYFSGRGFRGLGRTVEEMEVDAKRTRFLVAFGVLAFLWLLFWF